MAKRETGLARTARLLDLVPYLTTHQGVAISELARTFNTSVKEITDDLNTLWMCGLPGYTPLELIDLEFESGFVSIRNAETLATPRALDRAEALSIYMGLDLLAAELSQDEGILQNEISKLQDQLRTLLISTPQIQIEANLASEYRALILRAIRKRGWLEITYHSTANDEITTRKIAPYELSQVGSHEYLQAYCDSAEAIRNFRADRIVKVLEISDQIWPEQPIGEESTDFTYRIKVLKESRQALEVFPDLSQGSNYIESQGYSHAWVARSVLSLGGSVEAIDPTDIREAVTQAAKAALDNYR
ncbi:MAG: WYL domain-containing protein [Candidatus Nanopelagicaceae bacterium]|nr:WYL domain-containing protein [Candidatus Nanopelagicaceae bacterium]